MVIMFTIHLISLTVVKVLADDYESWNEQDTTKAHFNYEYFEKLEKWHNNPEFNPSDIDNLSIDKVQQYFSQYNLFYDFNPSQAELKRYQQPFEMNIQRMIKLNSMVPGAVFRINEFTRLTLEEFTDQYTGFNSTGLDNSDTVVFIKTKEPPTEVYYVPDLGKWAKHQGPCKASYVFSAIATIELQLWKKLSILPILSAQQGYNCDTKGSCKTGGLPDLVMSGLMAAGSASMTSYPSENYVENISSKKGVCRSTYPTAKITNVIRFKVQNEADLAATLAEYGPLSIAIYVSHTVKNYHKGILDPIDCDSEPNHAVVLVGYGTSKDNIPYWVIKNSWGSLWGEEGFMRLIRGKQACNIGGYVATVSVVDAITTTRTATTHSNTDIPILRSKAENENNNQKMVQFRYSRLRSSVPSSSPTRLRIFSSSDLSIESNSNSSFQGIIHEDKLKDETKNYTEVKSSCESSDFEAKF